jgi:membrane associated rhomboid family serine protease
MNNIHSDKLPQSQIIEIPVELDRVEVQQKSWKFPFWIFTISAVQIYCFWIQIGDESMFNYKISNNNGNKFIEENFRLHPLQLRQVWRFFTIAFIHGDLSHVASNVFAQLLYGIPLELFHSGLRVTTIYTVGVFCGSLGFSVLHPQTSAIGASGGVFALLLANHADFAINWRDMRWKRFVYLGYISFMAIIEFSIAPNSIHTFGAIGGFLCGLIVLKNAEKLKVLKIKLKLVSAIVLVAMISFGVYLIVVK